MKILHVTMLVAMLMAGCSGLRETPPASPGTAGTAATEAHPGPSAQNAPPQTEKKPPAASPAQPPAPPVAIQPTPPAAALPPAAVEPTVRKETVSAPATKPSVPAASAAKPSAKTPLPAAKPAPVSAPKPVLDLATLEKRLKDTSAIGVMTKLTLKNQVDDLLDRFKAHYDGHGNTTLVQLRQPFELLIIKVISALQDGDPSLARAVADSREAIWSILSDPEKFRSL